MTDKSRYESQQLIKQLAAWRHNRGLYPGWLVAPKQSRDQIWLRTIYWIPEAWSAKGVWPSHQLLVLYRELFWRFDVALQYLPDELAETAGMVLRDLVSLVEQSSSKVEFNDSEWPDSIEINVATLKEDWIAVACDVLRHFRITQNRSRFEELHQEILDVAGSEDNIKARLAYELCIWSLSGNDREACAKELDAWPAGPADPYWQVKRGALYAELGDIGKAISLIENAVVAIRSTQRIGTPNISAMSRESWALQHLWQLGAALKPEQRTKDDIEAQKRRDRQRDLEAYRCSAENELRLLQSTIKGRPKPPPFVRQSEEPPEFDNGNYRQVFHGGSKTPEESLAPAINFLMMIERTGLPPFLRSADSSFGINFYIDEYEQALDWAREDFPGVWASWVPRFDIKGLGDGKLSRQTIGRLPDGNVGSLFVMACNHFSSLISQPLSKPPKVFGSSHWVEIATRLASRRDDNSREWMLTIAFSAMRDDAYMAHPLARDQINALLRRSLPFLGQEVISSWFVELLACRLPDYDRFRSWYEPIALIDDEVLRAVSTQRAKNKGRDDKINWAKVSEEIARLIFVVDGPDIGPRSSAILRLIRLFDVGFLTDIETEKFATAIWNHVDENGLPVLEDSIYKSILLQLPEVKRGQSCKPVLDWLDCEPIAPRFSIQSIDGKDRRSVSEDDPDRFLPNLYSAILISLDRKSMDELFQKDRVHAYCRKILDWWKTEAALYRSESEQPNSFMAAYPKDRFDKIVDVLEVLPLPEIENSKNLRDELSSMVQEFAGLGFSEARLAPMLAFLDRENADRYPSAIICGLSEFGRFDVHQAIAGFERWEIHKDTLDLASLPPSAYAFVCFIVQRVVPPAVRPAIQLLTSLIERGVVASDSEVCVLVLSSVEVACRKLSIKKSNEGGKSDIDLDESPHLRREMAVLIGEMATAGFDLSMTIKEWLVEALDDPFVDVRLAAKKAVDKSTAIRQ